MNKKRNIILLDNVYDWKKMSLYDFLEEYNVPDGWEEFFNKPDVQKELKQISDFISRSEKTVFPMIEHVFRSFIPLGLISVVILGQDPYHNGYTRYSGSANGLCFSVKDGNRINPSLRNIYKELRNEGFSPKEDCNLFHWKKQGCLLLNTSLTVEVGSPSSHCKLWDNFSKLVVDYINNHTSNVVWLLMGKHAQYYDRFISDIHTVFFTTHPSPFSCNRSTKDAPAFIGSGVFKSINDVLDSKIKW